MSEETLAQLPAGWHADPHGRYESRYFDGERWTPNVRDSTGGVTREPDAPALAGEPVPAPTLVADPPPVSAVVAEPAVIAEPVVVVKPEPLVEAEPVAPAGRSRVGLVVALVLLLAAVAVAVVFLTSP